MIKEHTSVKDINPEALSQMPSDDARELPEGWVEAPIADLVRLNPKNECDDDTEVGFVPMALLGTSYHDEVRFERRQWRAVKKGYTHFADGDVLLAKITPCFENGKAGVPRNLPNGLGAGSTEFLVSRPNPEVILPEYLLAFLKSPEFLRVGESEMTGTVGQKRLPKEYLLQTEIPLAPLAEQKRIADQLDTLLARVDACRERLNRVPRLLKRFRQAVLAAATSGELTEEWRESSQNPIAVEQAVQTVQVDEIELLKRGRHWGSGNVPELSDEDRSSIPSNWNWFKVGDLGNGKAPAVQIGPMSMKSSEFVSAGLPVLNVGCVQFGSFDHSKLNYLPFEKLSEFKRYQITTDDILFTRSGTVGRCAKATKAEDGFLMTFHLLRVRVDKSRCIPDYLYYAFRGATTVLRQMNEAAIGATRAGFNTRLLEGLDIPIPPLTEQHEIVRRVEALFAFADRIEARYAAARKHADRLTPALLAQAFRGELVPQDPNDEPALVLLQRIRTEREAKTNAKPKQGALFNSATKGKRRR